MSLKTDIKQGIKVNKFSERLIEAVKDKIDEELYQNDYNNFCKGCDLYDDCDGDYLNTDCMYRKEATELLSVIKKAIVEYMGS